MLARPGALATSPPPPATPVFCCSPGSRHAVPSLPVTRGATRGPTTPAAILSQLPSHNATPALARPRSALAYPKRAPRPPSHQPSWPPSEPPQQPPSPSPRAPGLQPPPRLGSGLLPGPRRAWGRCPGCAQPPLPVPPPARPAHARSQPLPASCDDAQSPPAAVAASSAGCDREAPRGGRRRGHHVTGTAQRHAASVKERARKSRGDGSRDEEE